MEDVDARSRADSTTDLDSAWPSLPLDAWRDTHTTLHLWTQIVGKIRLAQTPWVNHCWHVTLYPTARGLTTSLVPHGSRGFQIDFDFFAHRLDVSTTDGRTATMPLAPQSVARFYRQLMDRLRSLDLPVEIYATPCEVAEPIPFEKDEIHASYDPVYATRFARVLAASAAVFGRFRTRFVGKVSPVHFFWGAPDLAVTRFSGRRAPLHPGGIPHLPDWVTRDAYSHEVSSCGFWAGGGPIDYPVFYSYAYPEPKGFATAAIRPSAAFYSADLREFLLPYEAVRQSASPEDTLLEFLQTTYETAANLGGWDRASLECEEGKPRGRSS